MSESTMIFVDVAARIASQRGYSIKTMGEWLCFDRLDGSPAGRCMITESKVSRYAFDVITEVRKP